jgi:3-hydroxyisobutyrate dehydrogenase-like beta-hydroxyacid dehydrogenase
MGAALAGALAAAQSDVTIGWASEGRSSDSRSRAETAGLLDLGKVGDLASWAEVVISVCPPGAAEAVADTVAGAGFAGLYVDANAIAPATARRIGNRLESAGAVFVDGGIVGPPPETPGTTRLYLAGERADDIAALFAGGPPETVVVPGGVGAASAVKAAYAAWTKGSGALLLAARALARAEGVEDTLVAEWDRSQPGLAVHSEEAASGAGPKAWRLVAEMEEQAEAFAGAGLPDGFSRAAADVFARMEGFRDAGAPPSLEEVLRALTG